MPLEKTCEVVGLGLGLGIRGQEELWGACGQGLARGVLMSSPSLTQSFSQAPRVSLGGRPHQRYDLFPPSLQGSDK